MKNFIPIVAFLIIAQSSGAQKKVVPVSQSVVTTMALPIGSKKDGRLLVEVSAKALLQAEAKKTGAAVDNIEVLYLPVTFNNDSLNQLISVSGWTATPSATDNKYLWLQKDGHSVLAYFSPNKAQAELYVGETSGGNNAPQQQTATNEVAQQTQSTTQQNIQQTTQSASEPAVNDGYAFTTTNFDDGWTSTVKSEWVEVTKGDVKVYIWYALPYNASDFSGTGVVDRDYYWDNYVTKYFNVQTKQYNDNGEVIGSFKPSYVEGWVTDKQTGERRFIGMRLGVSPNTAWIIIASVKDEATLRQHFPKANDKYTSDLSSMSSYNKFAVGPNDLTGKWSNSSGGTMSWYSTTTGQNVGATGVAKADVFNFNNNSTYTSVHNGATGWIGSMSTYQQNYKGSFTLTNWQLSMTNRWDNKTEIYDVWFEVGKGKRQLHLAKPGGGMSYNLFKEK